MRQTARRIAWPRERAQRGGLFWWAQLGGTPTPRAPLPGDLDVDVCIVGAGYTGLWSAYYLKRAQPDLRIACSSSASPGSGHPAATAAG